MGLARWVGVYNSGNVHVNYVHEVRDEFDVLKKDNNFGYEYEDTKEGNDGDEGENINEIMEGVDDHFDKRPRIFERMTEAARKLLYRDYTKYT